MATNNILLFCPDGSEESGDLLSLESYRADAQRLRGNQPGIARRELVNKALKQATFMSSVLGQLIADNGGVDAVDSGTVAAMASALNSAIQASAGSGSAGGVAADIAALWAAVNALQNSGGGGGLNLSTAQGNVLTNNNGLYLSIGMLTASLLSKPTSGSLVDLKNSGGATSGKLVLPSGGTWAWYYWAIDFSTSTGQSDANISAGGTTVYSGSVATCSGWALKIS